MSFILPLQISEPKAGQSDLYRMPKLISGWGKEPERKEAISLMKVETEKAMALGRNNFVSHWVQGAFDLRRRCRPCRYPGIAPAASALPQTKIPPAIRKFLLALGIN
jgi:hypothetical protein